MQRLALRSVESTDEAKVVRPLLDLMAAQKLDFHGTFRVLATFRPGWVPASEDAKQSASTKADFDKFVERLLAQAPDGGPADRARSVKEWREWLDVYARRIQREADQWDGEVMDAERATAARAANPRFVLRQWLLQEVIAAVEKDSVSARRILAKVLHVRAFYVCLGARRYIFVDGVQPFRALGRGRRRRRGRVGCRGAGGAAVLWAWRHAHAGLPMQLLELNGQVETGTIRIDL